MSRRDAGHPYIPDKTDQFTVQIEAKQRELEPWTTKINEKQSAIDVATSERDLLQKKASGAQDAFNEARINLETLKQGGEGKQEEYASLKKEAVKAKKALGDAESKFEVRPRLRLCTHDRPWLPRPICFVPKFRARDQRWTKLRLLLPQTSRKTQC